MSNSTPVSEKQGSLLQNGQEASAISENDNIAINTDQSADANTSSNDTAVSAPEHDDPLVPYPPEAYEAVGANDYVSDVLPNENEAEPATESGGGNGNGTDNSNEVDEDEADDAPEAALSLTDHFRELRNRLIKIFIGIIAGFLICWGFSNELADILYKPLVTALPSGDTPSTIIFTGIAEGFFTHMKLAIVAGIFVMSPFIFYQIWSFIAPGLYDEEKKFVVPVAVCSAICFIAGGLFCYFVVFPNAFRFFMTYSEGPFTAMPSMKEYFNFTIQLILAFGIVFELPVFSFFLARIGLVTAAKMRRFRRYFIVVAFILGAMLTPPDVISQLLMAAPMLVLYEVSILIAAVFGKKAVAESANDDDENDNDEGNTAPEQTA